MKNEFKIIGKNITYEQALKLKIPKGYKLATFKDTEIIINDAEKQGIKRDEHYYFKQFIKQSNYKLSVLWLGRLGINSNVIGDYHDLFNSISRVRGVIIKKVIK